MKLKRLTASERLLLARILELSDKLEEACAYLSGGPNESFVNEMREDISGCVALVSSYLRGEE